jgi:hypothetical protein
MKRKIFSHELVITLIFLSMTAGACSMKGGLRTEAVRNAVISGSYTLILHGCRYLDDPETIAFLDKEGDGINFDPFTPAFNYKVKKGLSAEEALAEAGKFLACSTSFQRTQLSSILDDKGAVLGYELRPLYFQLTYGVDDILMTDYRIRDDRLVIKIMLIPSVDKMLHDGGSNRDR